jgi:hypothetical protein
MKYIEDGWYNHRRMLVYFVIFVSYIHRITRCCVKRVLVTGNIVKNDFREHEN